MTKLTQELALRLEQGETFVSGTQWQTEKQRARPCNKSEDGKSPSEQDWGNPVECAWGLYTVQGFTLVYTRSTDILCDST